ncbi:MAG TPA: pitrilysin family protein, partial [Longimicrobiaceae bacterium]|nr:pitrilysin family protein [Longimicrobiaceae bacterium]
STAAPAGPAPANRVVGERLIVNREPESPFIAFNVWVQSGSAHDPAGKEGLAALTASLLAGGSTTSNSYEEIRSKLYPMATAYGSSTDKEMTVFRGVVHRDNLDAFYALLRDAVAAPAFREEDFERVKTQTVNFAERARRFSRDEELTKELLYREAYRGTPYEHPVDGYVQSIRSITLDDVRQFYDTHYRAGNVVVALGGGFPDGFAERVRGDFDTLLKPGEAPRVARPQPSRPDRVKVLLVEKPTDASPVSIGFPISVLRSDPEFPALMLANSWLGEHRNSFARLYQLIREQRGMNYGNYSYVEAFPLGYTTQLPPVNVARRSHLFEAWIRPVSMTAPGNLHDRTLFATRAALREMDRLASEGLPDAEVARTKQFLGNYVVNWGNTIGRRLGYDVDDAFYGIPDPGFLSSIRPALASLTPEQVNTAVKRHLSHGGGYHVVIITSDAEGLKRKLLSGAATPITYAGERSPELLAEDREIASYPIPVRAEDITIIPIAEALER